MLEVRPLLIGDKVIKVVVGEGGGWEGRAQQVLLGRLSSRW